MTYSRRARNRRSRRLTRLQAGGVYLVALAAGLLPVLSSLVSVPGWVLTLFNAPAALGCLYLGVGAASLFGKALCLAWALFVGGWVRQSRSPAVLVATLAAHCLALGGIVRAWTGP